MAVMKNDFGGSKKLKLPTPGVGSYDVEKSTDYVLNKIYKARIGTSTRAFNNISRNFPGPA